MIKGKRQFKIEMNVPDDISQEELHKITEDIQNLSTKEEIQDYLLDKKLFPFTISEPEEKEVSSHGGDSRFTLRRLKPRLWQVSDKESRIIANFREGDWLHTCKITRCPNDLTGLQKEQVMQQIAEFLISCHPEIGYNDNYIN